jgi:cysteine-rich repeat protein
MTIVPGAFVPIAVLLAGLAAAQTGPVGPEVRATAGGHVRSDDRQARVASDASGNFVIVWRGTDVQQGDYRILARRFDAAGAPLGPAFQLSTAPVSDFSTADVATTSGGDFVVVWQEGVGGGIVARRFDASGAPQGSVFQVSSSAGDLPVVVRTAADGLVVTWRQFGSLDIHGRRFDAAGAPLGAEFTVGSSTGAFVRDMAATPTGEFVVVWASTGPGSQVLAQRYDSAGTPVGGVLQVSATNQPFRTSVAMAASGAFVVTWDAGPSFLQDIFLRRFDASGAPLGGDVLVNTLTAGFQSGPRIAMDPSGGFLVTWNRNDDGSTVLDDVSARRYDSAGVPEGPEFKVNAFPTGEQHPTDVAADAAGRFIVAWDTETQFTAIPDAAEIMARCVSATCGDGTVEAPEQCDDGGTADGDGCSASCLVDGCWTCTGTPSSCAPVASCAHGDGCCFPGCGASNDDDCPAHITGQSLGILEVPLLGLGDNVRRRLGFVTNDPLIDGGVDALTEGATFQVYNASGGGDVACFELPPAAPATWTNPRPPVLAYRDRERVNGACHAVRIVDGKRLKVTCRGSTLANDPPLDYTLNEPSQGAVAVRFRSGSREYCTVFGGTVTRDQPRSFKAKGAPAPAVCPIPPAPCP